MEGKGFKYAYDIDLDTDTTPAKVLRLVGRDKAVLELGCGPGHMSKVLKGLGCRVTGVEIDEEAAEAARSHCEEVLVGNLDELDLSEIFEGAGYDVVLMADVLEHLRSPERILSQCTDLLAPGGYIVVSIPNVAYMGIVAGLMQARFTYSEIGLLDETHIRFFTGPSFRSLLGETGFVIDEWLTHEVPVEYTEFSSYFQELPEPIQAFLDRSPDSRVYQFIVKASPRSGQSQDEISNMLSDRVEKEIENRDLWFKKRYCFVSGRKSDHGRKGGIVGRLQRIIGFIRS